MQRSFKIVAVAAAATFIAGCATLREVGFTATARETMSRISRSRRVIAIGRQTEPDAYVQDPERVDSSTAGSSASKDTPAAVVQASPRTEGSPIAVPTAVTEMLRSGEAFSDVPPVTRESVSFDSVAERVRALPDLAPEGVNAIALNLVEVTGNQWELAFAVYVWIADYVAYDARSYFAGTTPPYDPESVLRRGRAVCEGYSRLYEAIGNAAGLRVARASGYAKGDGHTPGAPIRGTNHAWNRVRIQGEWYLVDSTWGAGHLDGRAFRRRFEDFYFAPEPEALIFSHYPSTAEHQYLDQPLVSHEFSQLPDVDPAVFELGLDAPATLASLRAGGGYEPPEAFATPDLPRFSIRSVDLPLAAPLQRGETYRFAVVIDPPLPATIVVGYRFVPMEREDGVATATVVAGGRRVGLALRPNENVRRYSYVLSWRVE